MLSPNLPCFLLIPNQQNERILIPGKVLQLTGNTQANVEFNERVGIEPNSDTILFAEWRGKFFQQAVTVVMISQDESVADSLKPTVISFNRVGEPLAADGRGSFRVSVAASKFYGRVDGQEKCHIVDVSSEGCGIICNKPLTIGQTVQVSFTAEGVTVEGPMKVQGCKQLPSGKLRFGFFAPDKKSAVRRGLEKMSMLMQRMQLKRLAGAA